MANGLTFSNLVVAFAAPITMTVVWTLTARRNPQTLTKVMLAARTAGPAHELMPARWFHHLAAALLFAMPFAQYFGYLSYTHWIAVIVPLALALAAYIAVGVLSPRTVFRSEPDYRNIAVPLLVAGACMLAAFAMPESGPTKVMQGVLIDTFGLLAAIMLIRYLRTRPTRPSRA